MKIVLGKAREKREGKHGLDRNWQVTDYTLKFLEFTVLGDARKVTCRLERRKQAWELERQISNCLGKIEKLNSSGNAGCFSLDDNHVLVVYVETPGYASFDSKERKFAVQESEESKLNIRRPLFAGIGTKRE